VGGDEAGGCVNWPIQMQLPYPISVNRYLGERVVAGKSGQRPFVIHYLTADAKDFKHEINRIARHAGVTPIVGPIEYELDIVPQLPQDWHARAKSDPWWWDMSVRCIDIDNAVKVLLDALNGVAWTDDSWICRSTQQRAVPESESCCILRVRPFARSSLPLPRTQPVNMALDLPITHLERRELAEKPF
jgi:crossover junction endodeoxyribonuclease RusA